MIEDEEQVKQNMQKMALPLQSGGSKVNLTKTQAMPLLQDAWLQHEGHCEGHIVGGNHAC